MLNKFNIPGTISLLRAIISIEQLQVTTHKQNQRKDNLHLTSSYSEQSTCLGKILTALMFNRRTQLKSKLNVQLITLALILCALLFGASSASAAILSIPATIQADAYSKAGGVKNEPTTDVGGGNNTGSIDAGDWMNYSNHQVNILTSGYYIISYRAASLRGGGSFVFNDITNSVVKIDLVSVPKTGGWQTWTTIQRKVYLRAGPHYFGIVAITSGINLNWFKITNAPSVSSSSTASSKSSAKSSSSSSKSSVASSIKSSTTSSIKASSAAMDPLYTHVAGPVALSWVAPKQREDKTVLDITELGGYQLRYKLLADKTYTYIIINSAWTSTYNFSWLEGDYVFQIAAFDKTGVLSDFAYFPD